MQTRRSSWLTSLLILPWWAGLLFGTIGATLIIAIPTLIWKGSVLEPAAHSLKPVAYGWFAICSILSLVSAIWLRPALHPSTKPASAAVSTIDLLDLSNDEFDATIVSIFQYLGYSVLEREAGLTHPAADHLIERERTQLFVSCRHWRLREVGVKQLRELASAMRAADIRAGFFVTTGTYTKEAREFAGQAEISLIDGAALKRLVSDASRATFRN